ncbi:hypothetical protein K7432_001695 [Basidiobolus ranarum]|uniref:Rab-GAP TBC domain-containing protein n=2 Tax=Basidiobolus ranarum TaxID=34480 RepID=A0ABR2X2K2_9FUNG
MIQYYGPTIPPSPRPKREKISYMLDTLGEFEEILNAEMYVDLGKLRRSSRHGIPSEVRGEVWKFLLGVEQADRSHEMSSIKARAEEYQLMDKENTESSKRIHGEVSRYCRKMGISTHNGKLTTFENVISAYLNRNKAVEYTPALVSLCGPFVETIDNESEVFFCFERLMTILSEHFEECGVNEIVAKFLTLFRISIPDLYNYFQEEEVDLNEWATSWLLHLLAKELPLECLLRLWDSYFSSNDFLELHLYVCIAMLRYYKDNLEELEHSEIRALLLRLPELDMDQVIHQAIYLMHEIKEREISDTL